MKFKWLLINFHCDFLTLLRGKSEKGIAFDFQISLVETVSRADQIMAPKGVKGRMWEHIMRWAVINGR